MSRPKFKPWVELQQTAAGQGEVFSARSVRFNIPNGGGLPYENNGINIVVGEDGHIALFSDDVESHIYFYPSQVVHLKKAIAVWNGRKP